MGDVGERAAMDEGGIVLQRLHEVRLHRVLQEHGHRAVGLQVAGGDRALVAAIADDDVAEAPFEVLQILGKAQDRHDLGGDGDVEAGLARKAVGGAAERDDDVAQRPVVHVQDAPPGDAPGIDAECVAPVDVVVDHRGEEIVRRGDGVEVAGEVEVHLLHRHDLRIAAAGRAAFDAEAGPERGLADADRRLPADAVEPVAEPDGGRGLALAGRRRVHRGDEDQPARRTIAKRADEAGRDLGLVVAIGNDVGLADAELCRDLSDRALGRGACDGDVGRNLGHGLPGSSGSCRGP